jgi:hypothetical protein
LLIAFANARTRFEIDEAAHKGIPYSPPAARSPSSDLRCCLPVRAHRCLTVQSIAGCNGISLSYRAELVAWRRPLQGEQNMNVIALDRKPIFDAVRRLLGRAFRQEEVEWLDRAIDLALGRALGFAGHRLGSLSERFESGGRGPGTVSGGVGDPGGVSYGTFQLSSRTGTAARFMVAEGAAWAREFGRAAPGSAAFSRVWRRVAEREGEAFGAAQHAFIERTHYRPAVAAVFEETGLDLDSRHPAVRDAAWSVAVQHGRAARILSGAVLRADEMASRDSLREYDRALIEVIYTERTEYVLRVAQRSNEAAARMLRSITRNRYPAELQAALKMLEQVQG